MPTEASAALTVSDDGSETMPVQSFDSAGAVIGPQTFQSASGLTATVTGNSPSYNAGDYRELLLLASVTAAGGTSPSLTFSLDASPDGGVTWVSTGTATTITGVTTTVKTFGAGVYGGSPQGFGTLVRLRWIIAGTTPSFTFSAWLVGKP